MKILVVDDEPSVVDTLSDFLGDCGHQTVPASDGVSALAALSQNADVGLVVADVRMPRMDGIEFLRTLKVRYPGVPAILITGHGDEGLAVSALQEGASDYIKKPIKLRELRSAVGKIEERHALEAMIATGLERDLDGQAEAKPDGLTEDLARIQDELDGLAQLWEAVRSYLSAPSEPDSERRVVDFAVDEIPAAFARLRGELDQVLKRERERQSRNLDSLF